MAKLADELAYRFALLGKFLAGSVSARTADRLGSMLGTAAFQLFKSRRQIAKDNLRQAFGDAKTETEIDAIARNVFRNIGRTLFEIGRFEKIGNDGIASIVVPPDLDFFKRARERGRGAVLVSAHFGNWEMLGGWFATVYQDFRVIATVQHNAKANHLIDRIRGSLRIQTVPAGSLALRNVFKALKGNQFVAIVSDQHDPSRELILDFFGRKAAVPKGPALFAIKAQCPLAIYMMRRERFDRHVVMFGGEFEPENTGNLEEDIRSLTVKYLKVIEDMIRQYPDQWLWTHRRWKI